MRLWYLNHYASTPDQPMTGAYYLMQALAGEGHEVRIFAAGFNYYRRRELHLTSQLFSKDEMHEAVRFTWLRTTPAKGGAASRLLNMLTYMLVATGVGICARQRPDVVMATCPHPFAAVAGWLIAKRFGAAFVYEIRDIWPESMTQGGVVSASHPLVKIMAAIQRYLYRRAALVVSVLPRFDAYLNEHGIPHRGFLWVPNSVAIDRGNLPAAAETREHFTFMYLGGHSKYQGLDTLLEAARLLQQQGQRNIRLVLVGDGSEKARLIEKARAWSLQNIEFRDAVPRSAIMSVAAEADAFVLHFEAIPLLQYGMSNNKLCDYMLAGRPILFAAEAANNPVKETGSGVTAPPEDPAAMSRAMLELAGLSPEARRTMGKKAQDYALEHFDVTRQARKLGQALAGLL